MREHEPLESRGEITRLQVSSGLLQQSEVSFITLGQDLGVQYCSPFPRRVGIKSVWQYDEVAATSRFMECSK